MKESPHGKGMTILIQIKKKNCIVFYFSKYFYLFFNLARDHQRAFEPAISERLLVAIAIFTPFMVVNPVLSCLIDNLNKSALACI